MPHESSSEQEPDDSDAEFVEIDPSGRYGRYKEVLGRGAFKKLYRAFDELEGIEVAWNQVKVTDLVRNAVDLERLYSELHLLKILKHKNIIKFYTSWVDTKNENINFITEIFTSGTLWQYRKKHKNVDLRALKKWSRQILEGLLYLHSHDPPVIHRDLKCDNIFVNGNQGEVKIGDLGLAAILQQARSAHSVISEGCAVSCSWRYAYVLNILLRFLHQRWCEHYCFVNAGTPEFMAPELYEEEYNELVDIYAFGMCLLELVTVEYPYVECANAAQIYKKVTSGIKPASLAKVTDPTVKAFIEKCIAKVSNRLSAKELLMDPFLRSDEDSVGHSLQPQAHHSGGNSDLVNVEKTSGESAAESARDFTVKSQMKGVNTVFLKLRITDSTGQCRNIHFPFDITVDTAGAVASEMVEELDLTDQDVSAITSMIESEIRSHIPDWEPGKYSPVHPGEAVVDSKISADETKGDTSSLTNGPIASLSCLGFDRLPSGRKYWWSDSPKTGSPSSRLGQSSPFEQPNSRFGDGNSPKDGMGAAIQHDSEDDDYDAEDEEEVNKKGRGEVAENCEKFEECEPDLKMALEKVNDLWKKHELELSDLLDDISPEFQQKVLEAYKTKLPNYTKCMTQK